MPALVRLALTHPEAMRPIAQLISILAARRLLKVQPIESLLPKTYFWVVILHGFYLYGGKQPATVTQEHQNNVGLSATPAIE
ncbi:hypothetical protein J2X54_001540 [Duganella sp. 3397]|uniref:hypothetical protein n=1 Tax=Duganella sp. 3397 TaxID=2817732 RepID=UPI00285A1987|nr:hypothetical protein [Duganella sp. 3397]MDR7049092.1 hypothetical protein [Duganella sp. 3397]